MEMLAASMRRTRTRTLLLSILGRGPIFGGRWSDRAALKMPQHVAVVAFLCGITRPSPAQLRSDTPAQIIDRESTTIGKLVDKWASDRAARVALERSLLRRGVREGAELEGLLAAMIWAGDA